MKEKEIAREPFYQLNKQVIKMLMCSEYRYTLAIYILFEDRAKVSKYKDKNGTKYFIYSIEEIRKELKISKSKESILKSIEELEKLRILKAVKSRGKATRYYFL